MNLNTAIFDYWIIKTKKPRFLKNKHRKNKINNKYYGLNSQAKSLSR